MRYLYIALGGALGTLARWGLEVALLPHAALPLGTLAANLSGSFGLGWAFPYTLQVGLNPDVRLGVVTGFFGGFTTFSTWMAGTAALAGHSAGLAAVYLVVTLFGGVACALAGMALSRRATGEKGAAAHA